MDERLVFQGRDIPCSDKVDVEKWYDDDGY